MISSCRFRPVRVIKFSAEPPPSHPHASHLIGTVASAGTGSPGLIAIAPATAFASARGHLNVRMVTALIVAASQGFSPALSMAPRSAVAPAIGIRMMDVGTAVNAAIESPAIAAAGALALGAVGSLLFKSDDDDATAQNGGDKIAALKAEGEAVIARRQAIAAALSKSSGQLYAPPDDLVGRVVPVEAVFNRLDKDSSGSLDESELKEALVAAGRPSDDEAVRETLASLDTNNDGVVSYEEFVSAPRELAWWEKGSY